MTAKKQELAEVVTEVEEQKLPATTDQNSDGGIPDYLRDEIERDAGKGLSSDQADNIIPLLYVLQSNSPQVNKRNEAYVEGAEPGDLWLRGSARPIVRGARGIVFQPCYFSKDWVEWVPRDDGGGYVGRYADKPGLAIEEHDEDNPNLIKYSLPNGNELKETRYHTGIVYTEDGRIMPYVIPLTGTGHSVSRQFMFMMNSNTDANDRRLPSFTKLYRLKTRFRKNKKGEWFTIEVSEVGFVTRKADYLRGRELHEAFERGEKKVEEEMVATGTEAKSADDENM